MKRRFVLFFCAAFAGALVCLAVTTPSFAPADKSAWNGEPFFEAAQDLIDLNTAPAAELMCLPEIGEKRAQAIIAYRVQNGPFSCVDELTNIKGISSGAVDALRPLVYIS